MNFLLPNIDINMKYIIVCLLMVCYSGCLAQNGNWISLAPMPTARQEMPSVEINGKIYVIGGLLDAGTSTDNEIYTPATNTWTTGADIPSPRHHHMVAVANGKVYVIGGYISSFIGQNNNFVYDPVSNTWDSNEVMPTARGAGVAVEFNGKIYVIGGFNGSVLGTNEVYDPVSDSWQLLSPMPTPREHLAAAVLDSLIYVVGGRNLNGGPGNYRLVEAYSPATDTWYIFNGMTTATGGLASASAVGRVFTFGGEIPAVFEEVERFDPSTNLWTFDTPMITPRHGMGAINVNDTIYVIGGGTIAGLQPVNTNEAFIPAKTVNINPVSNIAEGFTLSQNYPNPFNPSTKIRFTIPIKGNVRLTVFDITGRHIEDLHNGELNTGAYEVTWNADRLSSGVYYYTLSYDDNVQTRKMLLVK